MRWVFMALTQSLAKFWPASCNALVTQLLLAFYLPSVWIYASPRIRIDKPRQLSSLRQYSHGSLSRTSTCLAFLAGLRMGCLHTKGRLFLRLPPTASSAAAMSFMAETSDSLPFHNSCKMERSGRSHRRFCLPICNGVLPPTLA